MDIGIHPNAGRSAAGLDILEAYVVLRPSEWPANAFFDYLNVFFYNIADKKIMESGFQSSGQLKSCLVSNFAAVFGGLVGGGNQLACQLIGIAEVVYIFDVK